VWVGRPDHIVPISFNPPTIKTIFPSFPLSKPGMTVRRESLIQRSQNPKSIMYKISIAALSMLLSLHAYAETPAQFNALAALVAVQQVEISSLQKQLIASQATITGQSISTTTLQTTVSNLQKQLGSVQVNYVALQNSVGSVQTTAAGQNVQVSNANCLVQ
jgi:hypothetical protein